MKKVLIWICLAAVVLSLSLMGGSYAWLQVEADTSADVRAGGVGLGFGYLPRRAGDTGGFQLENTGTLAVYVRVGYTFQYIENGQPLLRDVSSIEFADFSLQCGARAQAFEFATVTHTAGGAPREKPFLIPLDENGGYYLLQPGEALRAEYTLAGAEGEGLQVTWVAEAVQMGGDVLADAAEYGWDAAMAD